MFDGAFRIIDARIVGGKHLKLQLRDAAAPGAAQLEAIAFGYVGGAAEDFVLRPGVEVRLAYRLEVNEYNGVERVQLNCQHLKLG